MIELAELYLQILIIGFEGQYRGRDSKKLGIYTFTLCLYNRKEPGLGNKKSEVNGSRRLIACIMREYCPT